MERIYPHLQDANALSEHEFVEKHPETWFVELGLARGYSALGDFENAVKSMKVSLEKAPDAQKQYVQGLVDQLGKNVDIN